MKAADLGPRGASFWRHVTSSCDIGRPEQELLLEVCRTLDTVEALQEAAGDLRTLAELRQQRLALGRMLGQLEIPDDVDSTLESPATVRARRAANARWAGHEKRGAR
jgi:hypothetical protein